YSVVKLNTLASSDYRVAHYPQEDENTFGFFSTEIKKMNVDNSFTKSSEHSLLNRWNPEKKEIVYYLSDEFKKPEHSLLKKSTEEAFDQINSGLKTAGASIQLVLKDPAGKKPGDIRNSMIVMVEDPVAASVIGYGPSVINPLTGEILSARTV